MFGTFKIGTIFTIMALLLAGLAACTAEPTPKLSIQDPWVRPAVMGGNAAVYFTLVNKGNASDALVGASSGAVETMGIHETRMELDEYTYLQRLRMVPVPRIEVPAGGRTELEPGGFHVMLVELKQDLKRGDTVSVTLRLEKSDEITVEAEVRQP